MPTSRPSGRRPRRAHEAAGCGFAGPGWATTGISWSGRGSGRTPQLVSEFRSRCTPAVTHRLSGGIDHHTSGMGETRVVRKGDSSRSVAADERLPGRVYVERNPLRAGLVKRAEDWRWGSLYRRTKGTAGERALLSDPPVPLGKSWADHVNQPQRRRAGAGAAADAANTNIKGTEWLCRKPLRVDLLGLSRCRRASTRDAPSLTDAIHVLERVPHFTTFQTRSVQTPARYSRRQGGS